MLNYFTYNFQNTEGKYLRYIRARRAFKAIARLVIANLRWISDADLKIGDDVKKNISMLISRKRIDKTDLTLQEKGMLQKHACCRTAKEIEHLFRVIGSLKCFRKYSLDIKKELAAVAYFQYLGPGRVIIKQGHQAEFLYFILSGEVTITHSTWDSTLKLSTMIVLSKLGSGKMFGETSLLYNIPRTITVTTNTDCELLLLKKDDFNRVLKTTIQREWDNLKMAMESFSYFQGWEEAIVREFCMLSKMKSYQPDEIIYGDGVGMTGYVHFITKGQCQMVEHLLIKTKVRNGKKVYMLRETEDEDSEEEKKKMKNMEVEVERDVDENQIEISKMPNIIGADITDINSVTKKNVTSFDRRNTKSAITYNVNRARIMKTGKTEERKRVESEKNIISRLEKQVMKVHITSDGFKTVFMQVCLFNKGACFGLGENLKARRIIALSEVDVLIVPRYWLFMHNEANIWSRIKQFLEMNIPSTKMLFKDFVENRKWLEYRQKLVNNIITVRKIPTNTTIHDVPYSIRIREEINCL